VKMSDIFILLVCLLALLFFGWAIIQTGNKGGPILPPEVKVLHPGRLVKQYSRGYYRLSNADVGIDYNTYCALCEEKRSITPEIAEKLEMRFPTMPAQVWLNLQENYDKYK